MIFVKFPFWVVHDFANHQKPPQEIANSGDGSPPKHHQLFCVKSLSSPSSWLFLLSFWSLFGGHFLEMAYFSFVFPPWFLVPNTPTCCLFLALVFRLVFYMFVLLFSGSKPQTALKSAILYFNFKYFTKIFLFLDGCLS